jgi:hypothetical protein
MTDPVASVERRRQVRWLWVAWRAGPLIVICVLIATLIALVPWFSQMPQPLGQHLTEWLLRVMLVGYAGLLVTALLGSFGLPWYVLHGRRRGVRRPIAARLWLACASSLIGLVGVEAGAAIWLGWAHRMPVLPTRFSKPSNPDERSIAVVGSSSALGFPYHPWVSVGQIVAWQMDRAVPGRRFTADIHAGPGIPLEKAHQSLVDLTRRPDAIIVYSGHNEFQARFETSRGISFREGPTDPILDRLYRLSLSSALCRLIYETVSKERMGGPPSRMAKHQLIDPPAYTPSEFAALVTDFHRRLEAIVGYCEQIGAVPILVIPPANEGGFEPNRSVLAPTISKAECDRVTREFEAAHAAEAGDPARALAGYRAILGRHPEFAEAHFRVGRLLERAGDYAEANQSYIRARDCDAFSLRCAGPFQDAYRAVARRHGCILIDGPAVLRRICSHGIVDDYAIHDPHHPTLVGYIALSQAILDAIGERKLLGWRAGPAPTIDPAETVSHFKIDQDRWANAAGLSGSSYLMWALTRYDPTERGAKYERLRRVKRQIEEGVPPEDVDFPGYGIRPAPGK